ncbi:MAG: helix-turn-helix transcriptional regulator [Candidatus Omnitrophica bacterium]|nr:helix-turn-helix transcriptional regulator [Candidatus Omnitrophota bacterium]
MKTKETFSNNVKKYRQKNNLTQEELSEISGVAYKYIQKIEGKTTPNVGIDLVEKLAKALKTTSSKLLES